MSKTETVLTVSASVFQYGDPPLGGNSKKKGIFKILKRKFM
jgi:hypothetical protein